MSFAGIWGLTGLSSTATPVESTILVPQFPLLIVAKVQRELWPSLFFFMGSLQIRGGAEGNWRQQKPDVGVQTVMASKYLGVITGQDKTLSAKAISDRIAKVMHNLTCGTPDCPPCRSTEPWLPRPCAFPSSGTMLGSCPDGKRH